MSLPPNTYGVRCEFNPGGQRYTYLVDLPHHGEINEGDDVVVASPKGGYKVIHVTGRTEDLSPVDLKYMKYIVQKVNTEFYNILMNNLLAGDEPARVDTGDEVGCDFGGNMLSPAPPTSPLIDEGDTPRHGDDPGASG